MKHKGLTGQRNTTGKSWMVQSKLFSQWLTTNFPPDRMPDGETVLLMWANWLEGWKSRVVQDKKSGETYCWVDELTEG